MVAKRPNHSGKGDRSTGDNFKAINGVSGIVESCLRRAGILTYAQFASLSPDDIITIVGNASPLSPEKIAKQNWIGQARELALRASSPEAPQEAPAESSDDAERSSDEQRDEKFVVELLLNHDGDVKRARAKHMRTGELEEWDGWREERLINFFERQAGIHETEVSETDVSGAEVSRAEVSGNDEEQLSAQVGAKAPEQTLNSDAITTEDAEAETEGATAKTTLDDKPVVMLTAESGEFLKPHKLVVWNSASNTSSNLARHDQPFDVRLILDLASLATPGHEPLVYDGVLNARGIGGQETRISKRISGQIERPGDASIAIKGLCLEPGSYLLSASVMFDRPGGSPIKSGAFSVQVESNFLHVY